MTTTQQRFTPESTIAGRTVAPYTPPTPSPFVDLALDANEGAPADDDVLDAVRALTAEDLRRYPDARGLEREIAARFGVDPERVVVTNGADDAIDRVCRAFLTPGRVMATHAPSFEMIERSARLAGAEVRSVDWADGRFPTERFVESIDGSIALAALVSPNNPTGGSIPTDDLRSIARAAAANGAVVLTDLAYVEFADADPTPDLLREPNVVIVRTFSKAMGLAGLRVGYAIAPPDLANALRAAGGPYPVSSVSLAAASSALRGGERRRGFIDRVRDERERLTEMLRSAGVAALDSQANFVAARFRDAEFVHAALASLGIAVRRFPTRVGLSDLLRITLPGDVRSFDRLQDTIETALRPQALLLDLDGVIADVGNSYRAAILETARSFGVALTPGEVAAAKRAGDANNDWALTLRLLESRGVSTDLPEVTRRFQRVYEGSNGAAALRENESLIPPRDGLRRLAERLPLAIVTGRPRSEAEWFLRRAGVEDLFQSVVCMEDAPAKPSAEPVLLALRRLGVERAWMLGDTPDDAIAARAAGVVPIGVAAPGEDPSESRDALLGAGCARVLDEFNDILEVLP